MTRKIGRARITPRAPVIAVIATAMAMGAAGAARADTGADGADPVAADGDILVTARHRAESLSKVPVSITVLTGEQVQQANLRTLDQFQRLAPSLQIQGVNPRNQTIAIRGLGANPGLTTEGFESGVGIYVDGVYSARSAITLFDMFDLDRVEVLRGPQGTLFGKNTTAGAINITTRAPEFTLGGSAAISYGNAGLRQLQATITAPIADTLAARLTIGDTRQDSSIHRASDGQNFYGLHNQSVKGQLLYKPDESFSLRIIGDYNFQYQNGPTSVLTQALPTTLANGTTVTGFAQRAANAGYVPIAIDPSARVSDIDVPNYWSMRIGGVSAQTDAQLGDLHVVSISAYRFFRIRPGYDGDATGASIYRDIAVNIDQRQFSQEFRVESPVGKRFEYTAGLYYFHLGSNVENNVIYGPQAAQYLFGSSLSPAVLDRINQYQLYNPKTDSYSTFGQATFHITSKLSAIGGLRYTYEDKNGQTITNQGVGAAAISSLPASQQAAATAYRNRLAPTLAYGADWKGGNVSGTAGVSFQATRDILAFGTYSRGFKSAGLNLAGAPAAVPKVIDPEHVNSYELGIKTHLFDRRFTLDASLFQTDVANFQATIYDPVLNSTYIANAGGVRSRGAEVDLSARLAPGLTATFAGSYTDAYYKSVANTTCPYLLSYQVSCNINGAPLAGVSRWAAASTVEYVRPVGRHEIYGGGDYSYRSSYDSNLNNDIFARIPGYGLLGAHLGIRAPDGAWDLSFWAKNLLNKFYYTVLSPNSQLGTVSGMPGDPRYYGVRLKVGF
jgi:iron complex outermembrane recepter protein